MDKNPAGRFRSRFAANMSFITVPSGTFSCIQNMLTWSEMNAVIVGHFNSQYGTKGVKTQTCTSLYLVFFLDHTEDPLFSSLRMW